ncbi:hypothetical protein ES703_43339 [subsurface metagenome]
MPQRFPRSTHAHSQWQQAEHGRAGRVPGQDMLVAPHPGVVVYVPGLGKPDHWMDQDVGPDFSGGPEGQLYMCPVHRVARLESYHPFPAVLDKHLPQLPGSVPQQLVVVMLGEGNSVNGATHVDWPGLIQEIESTGMEEVGCAKHLFRFALEIGPPDVRNGQDNEWEAFLVAQEDSIIYPDGSGDFFGYVEGDGQGPQGIIRQAHIFQDRFVVILTHESFQG